MNDDNILDDHDQYGQEPFKERESLHLSSLFEVEEIKKQVEYEPDQKPMMMYGQDQVLAPIMAFPIVFEPDQNNAINASRTTELNTTEIVYPKVLQVQVQEQKVLDLEESK